MQVSRLRLFTICIAISLSLIGCGSRSAESPSNTSQTANNSHQIGGSIQGTSLSLSRTVSTLAGTSPGALDGIGTAARFYTPFGITSYGTYLFVTDSGTIRKVVIATGEVTTLAGTAGVYGWADGTGAAAKFINPNCITTDGTNLFVTDSGTIRKVVIATGEVTTLAGTAGTSGASDGIGAAARFKYPSGITAIGTSLFVTDTGNNTIRKVVIATGEVTTLAGTAGSSGANDGIGAAARFKNPCGITTDGTNLFVTDFGNYTVRKVIITTGEVTTLAGTAGSWNSTDGTGAAARFGSPYGIITDGTNLFVTELFSNTIRKVAIATGTVTTLAGTAWASGSTDGAGAAARFYSPRGITTDGANLYVADTTNNTIRKVAISTGAVTTLAGKASIGSTDGIGTAAKFYYPGGITTDGTNLFVTDSSNMTIRKMVIATGAVTTLAGTAGTAGSTDGTGVAARFYHPYGITTDGTNLFVADPISNTLRKIVIATGVVTTVAGTAWVSGAVDGLGPAASFDHPECITTDGANLFVTDTSNNTIRKVVIATGVVTTLAGTAGTSGSTDGMGTAARFKDPRGITTDGTYLFVADTGNYTIRKVVISTGIVTTLAGTPGISGSTDGTGASAKLYYPHGITTDGTNLFVTDGDAIRMIDIATGAVTTLAGGVLNLGSVDGTGAAASFRFPDGITTDGTSLFIADSSNNSIRMVR